MGKVVLWYCLAGEVGSQGSGRLSKLTEGRSWWLRTRIWTRPAWPSGLLLLPCWLCCAVGAWQACLHQFLPPCPAFWPFRSVNWQYPQILEGWPGRKKKERKTFFLYQMLILQSFFFFFLKLRNLNGQWSTVELDRTLEVIQWTWSYIDSQCSDGLQKYQLFLIFKRIERNRDIFWIQGCSALTRVSKFYLNLTRIKMF